jgi:hypothetical protein
MKKTFLLPLLLLTTLIMYTGCQKFDFWDHGNPNHSKIPDGKIATDWYNLQLRFLLERNSSLNGAYFAYLGIGLYESVQPGIRNAVSLSTRLHQMPAMPVIDKNKRYNWLSSANAAMASLLKLYNAGLTPANLASIDSLEQAYNERIAGYADAETVTRSQAFGKSIATAVHDWSLTDNFNPSNAGYVLPPFVPGAWEPTPPALVNPPVQPFISQARPLVEEGTATAPAFPAAYSETAGSDFYNIVKKVYDVNQTLTQEQKDIALFWVDQGNGVGYTPPGHDFSIITQALEQTKANLAIAAETYAKTGIAEREATIVCFRSKYVYNLVRPVTYIRKFIDPAWLPFIVTPPHPEYPAAHAFITGAVMEAAEKVLGDHLSVVDHTYDFRGWVPRKFDNLFAAGEQAGISRLYGGIHYLPSINIGLELGHKLGSKIGRIKLVD